MRNKKSQSRHGSIYLITLITVAAIVSMVLIGVRLRASANDQSAIIEQMSIGSMGVLSGSEYALELMDSDPMWKVTAQTGSAYTPFTLNGVTYSGTILDADTAVAPTYGTTTYRMVSSSQLDTVSSSASIDVLTSKYDYIKHLEKLSAIHYWPLNEQSNPATAFDLIGLCDGAYLDPNAAAGDMNDEAGYVPVFVDSNDHISVPFKIDFKQQVGAVSLWMKFTGSFSSNTHGLLGMQYQAGGLPTLNIAIWEDRFYAYIDNDNVISYSKFIITGSGTVLADTWQHIVLSWDSSGMHLYVDGIEEASTSTNTGGVDTARWDQGGEQPLLLGGAFVLVGGGASQAGTIGSVGHIAYFSSSMTPAQVSELSAIKPDKLFFSLVQDSWVRVFE